jgi:hypothetical protein
MRSAFRPLPLLAFAEALADHLIYRRFHKARADAFAVPVALAVIWNEATIVLNVGVKLLHGFQEFPCCAIASRRRHVEVHLDRFHHLERPIDVPVPQKPLQPFQFPHHGLTEDVRVLLVLDGQGQAFGRLLEDCETHGYMETI